MNSRQADTVRGLTEAAVEELRSAGYSGMTVRNVASRAGVAPATAYTYFSSKNHLIAEVFWRRLQALPPVADEPREVHARVRGVLREVALLVADEASLALACTNAMLGDDPDVQHLRVRIGMGIRDRLSAALGDDGDDDVLNALEFAWIGAMVHAGMGYTTYDRVAERLTSTADLILSRRG
nr:TetR/AcrR family transcriptional regulator [Saccharopolyspora sp. HNM0983]